MPCFALELAPPGRYKNSASRIFNRAAVLVGCLLLAGVSLSQADDVVAEKPEKPKVANRKHPDYAFTGEFVGQITMAGESDDKAGSEKTIALQIRATGGQNFEAIQYEGGLPGEKKHKPAATKLIGRRAGDFLVLAGAEWAVLADKRKCRLVDPAGNQLGELSRVKRRSTTLGVEPPRDAIVLFDGTNLDQFTNAGMTRGGLLKEGADVRPMFQDFFLHFEFNLPFMPTAVSQQRGNSGCYIQSRYELQVLDSFATEPLFNGCGSIYRTEIPRLNMCLPPLKWQTCDIAFVSPRWAADGTKIRNAQISVWLNGVQIHKNFELPDKTGMGQPEAPTLLPTKFQNHGDPVRYRNIWIVDRGTTTMSRFPVYPPRTKQEAKPKKKKQ